MSYDGNAAGLHQFNLQLDQRWTMNQLARKGYSPTSDYVAPRQSPQYIQKNMAYLDKLAKKFAIRPKTPQTRAAKLPSNQAATAGSVSPILASELARSTSHLKAFYDEMIGLKRCDSGHKCCSHTGSHQNINEVPPVTSFLNDQHEVAGTKKTVSSLKSKLKVKQSENQQPHTKQQDYQDHEDCNQTNGCQVKHAKQCSFAKSTVSKYINQPKMKRNCQNLNLKDKFNEFAQTSAQTLCLKTEKLEKTQKDYLQTHRQGNNIARVQELLDVGTLHDSRNYCSPNFGHSLIKSSSTAANMPERREPAIIQKQTSSNISNIQSDKRLFHLALNNVGTSDNNYQYFLGIPSQRSFGSSNVLTGTAKSAGGNCHLWENPRRSSSSYAGDGSHTDRPKQLNLKIQQKNSDNFSARQYSQRSDQRVKLISSDKMIQTEMNQPSCSESESEFKAFKKARRDRRKNLLGQKHKMLMHITSDQQQQTDQELKTNNHSQVLLSSRKIFELPPEPRPDIADEASSYAALPNSDKPLLLRQFEKNIKKDVCLQTVQPQKSQNKDQKLRNSPKVNKQTQQTQCDIEVNEQVHALEHRPLELPSEPKNGRTSRVPVADKATKKIKAPRNKSSRQRAVMQLDINIAKVVEVKQIKIQQPKTQDSVNVEIQCDPQINEFLHCISPTIKGSLALPVEPKHKLKLGTLDAPLNQKVPNIPQQKIILTPVDEERHMISPRSLELGIEPRAGGKNCNVGPTTEDEIPQQPKLRKSSRQRAVISLSVASLNRDKQVSNLQLKQGVNNQQENDQTQDEQKFKISPVKIVNLQTMQANKKLQSPRNTEKSQKNTSLNQSPDQNLSKVDSLSLSLPLNLPQPSTNDNEQLSCRTLSYKMLYQQALQICMPLEPKADLSCPCPKSCDLPKQPTAPRIQSRSTVVALSIDPQKQFTNQACSARQLDQNAATQCDDLWVNEQLHALELQSVTQPLEPHSEPPLVDFSMQSQDTPILPVDQSCQTDMELVANVAQKALECQGQVAKRQFEQKAKADQYLNLIVELCEQMKKDDKTQDIERQIAKYQGELIQNAIIKPAEIDSDSGTNSVLLYILQTVNQIDSWLKFTVDLRLLKLRQFSQNGNSIGTSNSVRQIEHVIQSSVPSETSKTQTVDNNAHYVISPLQNNGIPNSSRGPQTIETGNAIELNSWLSPNSNSARLACFAQLTGRSTNALNTANIEIPQFRTIDQRQESTTKEQVYEDEGFYTFNDHSPTKIIEELEVSNAEEPNDIDNISAIDSSVHDTEGITQRKFDAQSPDKAFKITNYSGRTLTLTSPDYDPGTTDREEHKYVVLDDKLISQPMNLICRSYYEDNSSVLIGTPSRNLQIKTSSSCDVESIKTETDIQESQQKPQVSDLEYKLKMRDYTVEERNNLQSYLSTYQINQVQPSKEESCLAEPLIQLRFVTAGTPQAGNRKNFEQLVHVSPSPKAQASYGTRGLDRIIEETMCERERYPGSILGANSSVRLSRCPSRGRGPVESVRFSRGHSQGSMQMDDSIMQVDMSLPNLNDEETQNRLIVISEGNQELSQSQIIELDNKVNSQTIFNVSQVDDSQCNIDAESSWAKSEDDIEEVQTFVSSHMLFSHLMDFDQQNKITMNMLNKENCPQGLHQVLEETQEIKNSTQRSKNQQLLTQSQSRIAHEVDTPTRRETAQSYKVNHSDASTDKFYERKTTQHLKIPNQYTYQRDKRKRYLKEAREEQSSMQSIDQNKPSHSIDGTSFEKSSFQDQSTEVMIPPALSRSPRLPPRNTIKQNHKNNSKQFRNMLLLAQEEINQSQDHKMQRSRSPLPPMLLNSYPARRPASVQAKFYKPQTGRQQNKMTNKPQDLPTHKYYDTKRQIMLTQLSPRKINRNSMLNGPASKVVTTGRSGSSQQTLKFPDAPSFMITSPPNQDLQLKVGQSSSQKDMSQKRVSLSTLLNNNLKTRTSSNDFQPGSLQRPPSAQSTLQQIIGSSSEYNKPSVHRDFQPTADLQPVFKMKIARPISSQGPITGSNLLR